MVEQDSMLGGYRVLDLTEDGCMLCGKVLGDLGAEATCDMIMNYKVPVSFRCYETA